MGQGFLEAGLRWNENWRQVSWGGVQRGGSQGQGDPGGKAEPTEGTSMCDAVLAFQVQWPDGQTSSDAFWGARMLLELSGGSLG